MNAARVGFFSVCFVGGLLFADVTGASAQSAVSGGVVGGVNFSAPAELDHAVPYPVQTGTAGLIGGFITAPVTPTVAIQPEFLLSQRNYTEVGDGFVHLRYFELPVLARVQYPAGNAQVFGLFGPAFGFLNSATFNENPDDIPEDVSSNLKSSDVSLVLGAGLEVRGFEVQARYWLGLTNVVNPEFDSNFSSKTRTISLLVGYRFGSR